MTDNKKQKLIGYVVSDVGHIRKNNEDNFLLGNCLNENSSKSEKASMCQESGNWTCIGVFDGMGGIEGGEIASLLAAEQFQQMFLNISSETEMEIISLKTEMAFLKSNNAIVADRGLKAASGTTGTVVMTDGYQFRIFHLGDSRVYLLRDNDLYRLTKDQTIAQMKLDMGIYSSEDEVLERENHQLVEYLGLDETGNGLKPLESEWIAWQQGDRLLLCSDGLYDMCHDSFIVKQLREGKNPQIIAESLIEEALKLGGQDNVTVLVVERT